MQPKNLSNNSYKITLLLLYLDNSKLHLIPVQLHHRAPQTRPLCPIRGHRLVRQLLERQGLPRRLRRAVPASLSGEGRGKGSNLARRRSQ